MNKNERDKLRHQVYTLWYHAKDKDKKITYQKMLDLIEYTEDLRSRLKSVMKLFDEMV
tara:strand:+ start:45247 stop:45420 length:174 start_codon:yes stop_codon:yes gene_type:complete